MRMSGVFNMPNSSQKLFKIRNNEAKGTLGSVAFAAGKYDFSRGRRRED
jgi:hypothetical protein